MLASGVLLYLTGFENNDQDGTGFQFNFLLCNGARTWQRDENV
jgi:hypothetical protein